MGCRILLFSLLLAPLAIPAFGQLASPPITLHDITGQVADGRLGWSVSGAGDVDGDGLDDYVVGAPGYFSPQVAGYAIVISAFDGSILHTFQGTSLGDHFGFAVGGAGDVDGDGHADVIVGAPVAADMAPDAGKAVVFSGADGSTLMTFHGSATNPGVGSSVSGGRDVDGDGVPDLVVSSGFNEELFAGTPGTDVTVFSGATGQIIRSLVPPPGSTAFGMSAAHAGDVNGDGFGDVVVGDALFSTPALILGGRAWIFSGRDGTILHTLLAGVGFSRFGAAVAGAGDVDADGFDDVVVGAHSERVPHPGSADSSGVVRVYSGIDGSTLYTRSGEANSHRFGVSVAGAGDIDGDGYDDFAAGHDIVAGSGFGRAITWSGRTGAVLIDVPTQGTGFGPAVAGSGDTTGDGRSGLVVGQQRFGVDLVGKVVHIVTLDAHPGSNEDLRLLSGVGGTRTTYNVKEARAGDGLSIALLSPGGTFDPYPPLLAGQISPTSSLPPSPPGFPEVHLDPGGAPLLILIDGTSGPFAPLSLPPGGLVTPSYAIPAGLQGTSLMLQAFSLSAVAANGIFASTDGNEIRFVP